LACDACTIDTPSASPTGGPCEDSAALGFQTEMTMDAIGSQKILSITATRINAYCNKDCAGTLVREASQGLDAIYFNKRNNNYLFIFCDKELYSKSMLQLNTFFWLGLFPLQDGMRSY
jgi:hypothetical protein